MRFGFRAAMMWLLLLAMPLQGFAAATMIHCGVNHHRMALAVMAETHSGHEHLAAGQNHHAMDAASDHHDEPSGHHLGKLKQFKCSACAVCCVGVAMPTAAITFEAVRPAMMPDSFVLASHIGFVTDGPDRPPRRSLV